MKKEEFLAMSFPFGLKVDIIYNFSSPSKSTNLIGQDLDKENEYEVIPYCRPLSDLTKPIEHNGEEFVPAIKLFEDKGYFDIKISDDYWTEKTTVSVEFDCVGIEKIFICEDGDCSLTKFWIFQKLIEWHFDLFGGIDSGDAIDVNSLPENPYK